MRQDIGGEVARKDKRTRREEEVETEALAYLAGVEHKFNEVYDNTSTDVLHTELLTKLVTH